MIAIYLIFNYLNSIYLGFDNFPLILLFKKKKFKFKKKYNDFFYFNKKINLKKINLLNIKNLKLKN